MGIPITGYDIIMEMSILSEGIRKFTKLVIDGLVPNIDVMREYAELMSSTISTKSSFFML